MEKETSTTPSTSQNEIEKLNSTTEQTASVKSSGVITPQYIDPNQSLVTAAQLNNVEERLKTSIVKNAGGKTGLLWLVAILGLAAGGFGSYTAFMQQQAFNSFSNNYAEQQKDVSKNVSHFELALKDIDEAKRTIETKAQELSNAVNMVQELRQEHMTLSTNDQNLGQLMNAIQAEQKNLTAQVQDVNQQLAAFKERNPEDWMLAESFFMVNNANMKAVYEKDIDNAIWSLTVADELIAPIQSKEVLDIREAISKDLMTLRNISKVDFSKLGNELDRAYDNVEKLVFNGYSDKQKVFNKSTEPTEDIANWKENLQKSALEFSNRFIEIRRRSPDAANEFLTPEQELYVRENIKTRILLAKNALSHGEKEDMVSNLNQAVNLIKAYCEQENQITKTTLDYLNRLSQSEITIATPKQLESYPLFNNFAKEHLIGRGK